MRMSSDNTYISAHRTKTYTRMHARSHTCTRAILFLVNRDFSARLTNLIKVIQGADCSVRIRSHWSRWRLFSHFRGLNMNECNHQTCATAWTACGSTGSLFPCNVDSETATHTLTSCRVFILQIKVSNLWCSGPMRRQELAGSFVKVHIFYSYAKTFKYHVGTGWHLIHLRVKTCAHKLKSSLLVLDNLYNFLRCHHCTNTLWPRCAATQQNNALLQSASTQKKNLHKHMKNVECVVWLGKQE